MSCSDRSWRGSARRRPGRVPAALLALLALGACADLPQPYRGRPGAEGARLATPLAVRIAVPPPSEAMLDDTQSRALARQVAQALQEQEVPAVATDTPWPLDWRVEIVMERQGTNVRPRYRLLNADRTPQATVDGTAMPLQDWANPTEEIYRRMATQAAPGLARLLLQVDAARKAIDPAQLVLGPPRLRFGGVRGAPGDGNTSLATRMREFLGNQGFVVQESAEGATYGLDAVVTVTPPERGVQRVEIVWTVTRRDGEDLGRVAQLNEVPAGRLNGLWGDIAYVAAEEAADGVKTVVANAQGEPPPPAAGADPAARPLRAPPGGLASPGPLPPPLAPGGAPPPGAPARGTPAAAIPQARAAPPAAAPASRPVAAARAPAAPR